MGMLHTMLGEQPGFLFTGSGLGQRLAELQRQLEDEVAAWDSDELLKLPESDLVVHLVQKYSLECPVLLLEQRRLKPWEEVVRENRTSFGFGPGMVKLNRYVLVVPFTGSPEAFRLRPNIIQGSPPRAHVDGNTLAVVWEGPDTPPEAIRQAFDNEIQIVDQWLSRLRPQIDQYAGQLDAAVRNTVAARRRQILDARNVEASIGFPVTRAEEEATFTFPVTRKQIVRPASSGTGPFVPEPAFAQTDYEEALSIIANARNGFERSPSSTAKLDEEEIRDLLLVILNGHFQGAAGGELFNGTGKTDILIRVGDRNIFVGECKFWGGPAMIEKTLDQLLGYMVWRDTKGALLLFIKNKNVSAAIVKAVESIKEHPGFKQTLAEQPGERYDFLFRSARDADREIRLAVIPFAIQSP